MQLLMEAARDLAARLDNGDEQRHEFLNTLEDLWDIERDT